MAATAGDATMDDAMEGAWKGLVKKRNGSLRDEHVYVDYQKLVEAAVYQNGSKEETVREALRWRRWQWVYLRDFMKSGFRGNSISLEISVLPPPPETVGMKPT